MTLFASACQEDNGQAADLLQTKLPSREESQYLEAFIPPVFLAAERRRISERQPCVDAPRLCVTGLGSQGLTPQAILFRRFAANQTDSSLAHVRTDHSPSGGRGAKFRKKIIDRNADHGILNALPG
jgi:hypothetical protein